MPHPPTFRVSPNDPQRLETADGRPFFLLGDTAWELFHRLTLDEADEYLATRAEQGFAAIWAVALAEFDGLRTPNLNGDVPFEDLDPRRPSEPYWAHVDAVLDRAAAHGLGVGLLPTWGDKVTPMWGEGPRVFDSSEVARDYGLWLGRRYADREGLHWVVGGDRPPRGGDADWTPIWRAMAEGLRAGGARGPMTYHPQGGWDSTSVYLHREPWLDFNATQSGHGGGRDAPIWDLMARDRTLVPPKPTLDAEPNYEDHPVSPWPTWDPANGHFDDHDVRKQAYRSAFSGACGLVYGHHSVWQFASDRQPWVNHVLMSWRDALRRPGAESMRHLRALMEGEAVGLQPDPTILLDLGRGGDRAAALRDERRALVYRPSARSLPVRLDWLAGPTASVVRIDPRTGSRTPLGDFPTDRFVSLPSDDGPDAVFLIE